MGHQVRWTMATVALMGALACGKGGGDAPGVSSSGTPVRVRVVERAAAASGARYSGNIAPLTQVDVAFKVGGYIENIAQVAAGPQKRLLQEGDWVKKSALLAQIRTQDYAQRLQAAKANYADAVAAQKLAEVDLARAKKLVESNSVAGAELDTQSARYLQASARVDGASAQISQAQLDLSDCTLTAPVDGVVVKRRVELGSFIAPGTVAFTIADTRTVKAVFGVPDVVIDKLKIGSPVTINVEPGAREIAGTVTRIAPSADPKSRVFEVESLIANPKDDLKVGMIASLKLAETVMADTGVALPLTSIVRSPRDPRGFSVFVVEADGGRTVVALRDIKLGDVIGNAIRVDQGLKLGERVVAMGATLLHDGDVVNVIP